MTLLLLHRQSRKIERIWSRRSMQRARHCARRLTTSHEVAIRCRSEGGQAPSASTSSVLTLQVESTSATMILTSALGIRISRSGIRVVRRGTLRLRLTRCRHGKKFADVHRNGDLRWLRSAGKTQLAIECVPQVVDEIIGVVRLILQERVQQRTAPKGRLSTPPYLRSWKK